jgi:hypothetical protein
MGSGLIMKYTPWPVSKHIEDKKAAVLFTQWMLDSMRRDKEMIDKMFSIDVEDEKARKLPVLERIKQFIFS